MLLLFLMNIIELLKDVKFLLTIMNTLILLYLLEDQDQDQNQEEEEEEEQEQEQEEEEGSEEEEEKRKKNELESSGEIIIPFTSSPNSKRAIVIQKGDFACLDFFSHQQKNYSLAAGFIVDREQLIKDSNSQIVVRAAVYLNNQPVPLSILEEITLNVTTNDKDGVSNVKIVKDFSLFDDKESIYNFRVPDDLRILTIQLNAKVTQHSSGSGSKITLSQQWSCQINQSDDSEEVPKHPHLRMLQNGTYELIVVGKGGEPQQYLDFTVYGQHAFVSSEYSSSVSTILKEDVILELLKT